MLVDVSGTPIVDEHAPSMERGAAFLAELLTVGPETVAEALQASPEVRSRLLDDLHALSMFLGEIHGAIYRYHVDHLPPASATEDTQH